MGRRVKIPHDRVTVDIFRDKRKIIVRNHSENALPKRCLASRHLGKHRLLFFTTPCFSCHDDAKFRGVFFASKDENFCINIYCCFVAYKLRRFGDKTGSRRQDVYRRTWSDDSFAGKDRPCGFACAKRYRNDLRGRRRR